MSKRSLNLGTKSASEKMEAISEKETQSLSEQPIIDATPKRTEVSSVAKEKMEAMSRYNLKPATIGVKADLEIDDDLHLTIIAKKTGKDKQELAAEYILAGIEKDMKKIGIFEHKK